MNRQRIRLIMQLLLYTGLATFAALPVLAQVPVDEDGNPIAPLEQQATLEDYEDEELPILSVRGLRGFWVEAARGRRTFGYWRLSVIC